MNTNQRHGVATRLSAITAAGAAIAATAVTGVIDVPASAQAVQQVA
jgi:hypothetical protein